MIQGRITTVLGDDINTDDIIPAFRLQQSNDPEYFATYAFEKFDSEFRSRCSEREGNVVLAGKNFGCGSSREQAVYALLYNRVACVIAASFPDIFYRNSLANGLTLVAVPDRSGLGMGDELEVDLAAGSIRNRTRGTAIPFSMKAEDRRTFQAGGMTARVRAHLEEILTKR
ncbi:MAG: 3-isopropylmalate dehydratase small subunit [candidate division NC10 bacterium]|nr:3-isopropylmalate dehydratase small subunit [candidate division NC10 bacterium]